MLDYAEGAGKQYHIDAASGDIGKYVILPGDPKRCKKIAAYLDEAVLIADNREYITYTGKLAGERVSVTSTGIGGPSAAIAMEELVRCGADTFIRVGTCGGMQIDVEGGHLVVASGAIRMEGTSKEYAPIEFPAVANLDVTNALVSAASSLNLTHHVGVVQSKDSFYGQHSPDSKPVGYELQNKWKAWLKCGCLASEMETAALLVVGSCLRVRVGAVLLTIANQERENADLPNQQVHETDAAIQTAIKAIEILMQKAGNE